MISHRHFLYLALSTLLSFGTPHAKAEEFSGGDLLDSKRQPFQNIRAIPAGPISSSTLADLQELTDALIENDITEHTKALQALASSNNPRIGWVLSDLLRITRERRLREEVIVAAESVLSVRIDRGDAWSELTDLLIAHDVPAFESYLDIKRAIYTLVVPAWERLMTDPGEVDWRFVSWGGVGIDDRAYDQTDDPVNSIPAVDNPRVTAASKGSWLDNDAPVFGVVINGEARAYPRFILEIREMVNDTLGGRDFALPYCTLCGAAHVWFTDRVPGGVERPILRTSGLLIRSNKLMYDVVSGSVFDTFLGHATNGPLHRQKISLPGHPVISTTWGDWKEAHPETTVLAKRESLGRRSDLRTTRDANGPIFPVGDVDSRLSVQEEVLGVVTERTTIAFHVANAKERLAQGKDVSESGITLRLEGGGLKAYDENGSALVAHESFWFGWSQFRPDTLLWTE